jgi:CheY-like chemotaxis protein
MWNGKPINQKLVLVVDDDRSMRESLAGLLDVKGYSVLEAENGQKALDVLEKAPRFPCVILLDLAMPIMDGRGFLKLRARDAILRQIPVVVLSGTCVWRIADLCRKSAIRHSPHTGMSTARDLGRDFLSIWAQSAPWSAVLIPVLPACPGGRVCGEFTHSRNSVRSCMVWRSWQHITFHLKSFRLV